MVKFFAACLALAAVSSMMWGLDQAQAHPAPDDPLVPETEVELRNGDAAVAVAVEPGELVDATILALFDVLKFRPTLDVSMSPSGASPAINVEAQATGAVAAAVNVSNCPEESLCLWDQAEFQGNKSMPSIALKNTCVDLPGDFETRSAVNKIKGVRVFFLTAERCGDVPNEVLTPDSTVPTLGIADFGESLPSLTGIPRSVYALFNPTQRGIDECGGYAAGCFPITGELSVGVGGQ